MQTPAKPETGRDPAMSFSGTPPFGAGCSHLTEQSLNEG
jgi:hypothetical protein